MDLRHLEFHFDIVCPFAYLASVQVEALCERVNASLSWHPFLLGGVLQSTGRDPMFTTKLPPAKARHNLLDAVRWADYLGIPFAWHPRHPVRTLSAMRTLVALANEENQIQDVRTIHALYKAYWVDGLNLDQDDTLVTVLDQAGHDGHDLLTRSRTPENKLRLRNVSDAAAERGIFGAPALFVGEQHFWGQDRLHFVEATLQGSTT